MKAIVSKSIWALILTVSLSACGSSGSSYGGPNLQMQVEQAKQYVVSPNSYQFDGTSYSGGKAVDLTKYPMNQISSVNITVDGKAGTMKLYQQPYSVVISTSFPSVANSFQIKDYIGLETKNSAIPTTASAHYTGTAFDRTNDSGILSYNVDFGAKTGSGTISNLPNHGTVTLGSALILNGKINGNATGSSLGSGTYELKFFGPNAEEIAGKVTGIGGNTNNDIGFAGKK